MSDEKDPKDPAYRVGYRRPPKATRFKPGQSGNRGGRPKGVRPLGSVLQDILEKKVAVQENGKTRRIPIQEVIALRLANDGMRGDKSSIKLLFALTDRYGASPQVAAKMAELLEEDQEILKEYLKDRSDTLLEEPEEPDDAE